MERDIEIKSINIDEIIPNRFQPRLSFEPEALKELSESIKQYGIFQPLVVRSIGNKYEIIAGERRYKAATLAGFNEVPCIISELDDNDSAEIALVENLQRRDLTPIEEAKSFKKLLDRGYITQDQLAKRMGKSQSSIANKMRLLNLDEEVQQALLDSSISERHARSLLVLRNKEKEKELLRIIIDNRLTVRETDVEVKKMLSDDIAIPDFMPIRPEAPIIPAIPNVVAIKDNDFIPFIPFTEINMKNVTNEVENNEEQTQLSNGEHFVDIEKLTKSTQSLEPTSVKLDIMDLLRIDETPKNVQPAVVPNLFMVTEPVQPIFENTVVQQLEPTVEIPSVSVEKIPNIMDTPVQGGSPQTFPVNTPDFEVFTPSTVPKLIPQTVEAPYTYEIAPQPIIIEEEEIVPELPQYQAKESIKTYVTNDLRTAINTIRECISTLEKYGFAVDKDELDLKDAYQIVIKINKVDE